MTALALTEAVSKKPAAPLPDPTHGVQCAITGEACRLGGSEGPRLKGQLRGVPALPLQGAWRVTPGGRLPSEAMVGGGVAELGVLSERSLSFSKL